jgi:hypothetical protein
MRLPTDSLSRKYKLIGRFTHTLCRLRLVKSPYGKEYDLVKKAVGV